MCGVGVVLSYVGNAVVIVVVGVGDVGAVNILEFDFKTVTLDPIAIIIDDVVDAIEVVEGAVGSGIH
jgi:hypothetical protein